MRSPTSPIDDLRLPSVGRRVASDTHTTSSSRPPRSADGHRSSGSTGRLSAEEWGGLAPDDLRDALVAHAHDLGDGFHRQAIAVGGADRFVSLVAEVFARLLLRCVALGVGLCKGGKTRSGLWCLTFRSGDLEIV
jgi:hypothetical protein